LVEWLQNLDISQWVLTSDYGFPILLAFHSIGLAGVVGILAMLDLRVLGLGKGVSLESFSRLMPIAWLGFAVNALSGSLLFMANAGRLLDNWGFLLKMSGVVLGGVISWVLWRQLRQAPAAPGGKKVYAVTRPAQIIASISLMIWLGTIVFGRLTAYIMDHALLHGGS
jgi:hypothetical protein